MKFYTSAIENRNEILLRGYENGRPFSRKIPYQPTLFLPSRKSDAEWKTMHGRKLEPMRFDSMRDAKDFLNRYSDVSNFEIYGLNRFVYAFLNEEYAGRVEYDASLIRVANIDIEVASENGFGTTDTALEEVTAITVFKDGKFYVFGCGDYTPPRPNIFYVKCDSEKQLLDAFIAEWSRNGYPDVVTGWNINFFDIPYLVKRISIVLGEEHARSLSPWKFFTSRGIVVMGREQTAVSLAGIASLDYLEMYRKFTYTQQDSYRLDNIAHIELGERKLDYSEFSSLTALHKHNFQKFIDYNIHDVELVRQLDEKMKFIEMVYALAYDAKVNFSDVFTQVRMWDVLIHNHLWEQKIAIPMATRSAKDGAYEGAYVKDPAIGMHEWVLSFDLTSLYPHLIMQYNIGPDTIQESPISLSVDTILNKNTPLPLRKDCSLAANGWYFSNARQGFFAQMMESMYEDRAEYKNKMIQAQKLYEASSNLEEKAKLKNQISQFKNLQLAKKIQLNSAYGTIGTPYFRFFDLRQATAITLGGQLAIRWVEQEVNAYMNSILKTTDVDYVIASDTDSLYINFAPFVAKFLPGASTDKIVSFLDTVARDRFDKVIDGIYQELAARMNCYDQKMFMKREVIAERGIWTAKKRYILNVWDSEGVRYKEPKLKIMGIEAVKSSTPGICRTAIRQALALIMSGDQERMQKYIQEFRQKFYASPFEDVAFPRGLHGLNSYTLASKSIPIHVRGALSYNQMLLNKKLSKKYPLIREGEKIRFCYLRMPNMSHHNVISSPGELPKEFGLNDVIDMETQFEKAFLSPLRTILDVIGWSEHKTNTLEDFFA